MQSLSAADKQAALGAFVDPDPPPLELFDRSTLEPWAVCPMQASLRENGQAGPLPAIVDTGELVHLAFSAGIKAWLEACANPDDYKLSEFNKAALVRSAAMAAVKCSRPDLQPDAYAACRASVWEFSRFVTDINPENILAFDGGEDFGRSGQLAIDIPTAGVTLTSELDFLWQTHAPEVLGEKDWKSGWKVHWPEDVYKQFQFNVHAVLAFHNFPEAQALDVTICDVRRNRESYPVRFERKDLGLFMARINAALQSRYDHRDNPVPWPVAEKCGVCPVARHCSASGDIGQIAADPQAALREFVALSAKHKALAVELAAHVKSNGAIELETGERFASEHKSSPRAQLIAPKRAKKAKESDGDDSDGEA